MKAILCTRFGTPDDLELADIAPPVAAAGEVVVRVAAAALNFFDTLIIAGKYQAKPAISVLAGGGIRRHRRERWRGRDRHRSRRPRHRLRRVGRGA